MYKAEHRMREMYTTYIYKLYEKNVLNKNDYRVRTFSKHFRDN